MSKFTEALNTLFSAPEYSDRIPSTVREKITANGFGKTELTTTEANAIFSTLVNKFAKQELYNYEFSDVDLTRFDKGFIPFGDIIEEDFIDIATARDFPKYEQGGTIDPFVINKASVKPAYYVGTYELQYWVSTRTLEVKKAFMSENAALNFVQRSRAVLPESLKMDRYLIAREMLAKMPYAKEFDTKVQKVALEGVSYLDYLTPAQVQNMAAQIRLAVTAMSKSSTTWNKLGVMNSVPKKRIILVINAGVHDIMKTVLYNTYHDTLSFGLPEENILEISGFGEEAAQAGMYACLIDENALKFYDVELPEMENIYNPAGKYWNTWLSYQGKMLYSMHAPSAKFTISESE